MKSTDSRFLSSFGRKSFFTRGLNFQIEHHLFPAICHFHYPAISEIVKTTALEHGVPYNDYPTFTSALKSHISLLKKLGNKTYNNNRFMKEEEALTYVNSISKN